MNSADICKMADGTPLLADFFGFLVGIPCVSMTILWKTCGITLQGTQLSVSLLLAVSYRWLKFFF